MEYLMNFLFVVLYEVVVGKIEVKNNIVLF